MANSKIFVLLLGFLVPIINGRKLTKDCIVGETAGIVFMVLFSFILDYFGVAYFEPSEMAKMMLVGYVPGRVVISTFISVSESHCPIVASMNSLASLIETSISFNR